ncbi:hypothetical protein C0995_000068 [Termitomyces sp. Mi166|nr:hypothetical protein C0995_000068 [Termitomyces sp. Mi166\
MFKRVEKRRRMKEEEEELGLDEDMKQVLGMNDTDSEESATDSDDSDSDGTGGSGDERDQDLDEEDRGLDQVGGDEGLEELPMITIQEALRDPVYIISLEPSLKGCIVCPGKTLKGTKMAHRRRAKQFAALASGVDSRSNAWDLLIQQETKKNETQPPDTSGTSKRAQKRESRAALRKMRRDKQKAKAKAKKLATIESSAVPGVSTTASPAMKPPNKKQKTDELTSSAPPAVELLQSSRGKETKGVAAIARSASDRAKAARVKATKVGAKSKSDRNPKTPS